jgi:hypothetical protein
MAETKTRPTDVKVGDYVAALDNPRRRADAESLVALMGELSGEPAVMWGPTMIGFGHHRYVYDTGHSGELFDIGFSPRKANLVLYIPRGFAGADAILARLGKVKASTGCLYVNKLADLDPEALRDLVELGLAHARATYPRA